MPPQMATSVPVPKALHVFWDGNNILAGAQDAARDQGEVAHQRTRVYFQNLLDIVRDGRHPASSWMSGNVPPPEDAVWAHARRLGIRLDLSDRTAAGREGLLDQTLRERMLATDFDFPEKGTIALLSGDSAGYQQREGFYVNLVRLKARGWDIELYSWESRINQHMKRWVLTNGKYCSLDRWYSYITFIEPEGPLPGRHASRLVRGPYFSQ
jgi:hypothetical protein